MKRMCSSTSDIVSDLPDNILEKILVLMPIRDAVRTSVLSKKWRYTWRTIPELVFDDKSLVDPYPILFRQGFPPVHLPTKDRFLASIYHILLFHRGAILKFILSISWKLIGNRLLMLRHLNALELSDVLLGTALIFQFIWLMITNSPKLQRLTIQAIPCSKDDEVAVLKICEATMVSSDFYLKQLREVEMRSVSGTTPELHIMKLLLAYSPKLEIMVVKPHPAKVTDGGLRILKELSQFQRLSPKAKITYKHPNVRN
ncbi:hypothetical protein RHSIM_Rhsim12G0067300 [Rhododendron simsii]|uniref:F-box domain-containing protein n=1 Tax=Rhododendron simsii TaxID=118357 RepID=A0A834G7R5_RHOSS|nr:hypothetical protein RHSIM_Rhsim12G0067300 [Rhododendron simsii]